MTDARFQKIARERVADRVADEIMRLIASGELAPGERLPGERQLAELMDVSRVSVRAALQQLKAQGLLAAVQGGGTRVVSSAQALDRPLTQLARVDQLNMHDLAEIRAILEVWAVRRAALNASQAQIEELGHVLELMAAPARQGQYRPDDDVRFHLTIAKAAGSAVYCHILSVIRDSLSEMLEYHRYRLFRTLDDDCVIYGQHKEIYEAIRNRDPVAAEAAMSRHLQWVLKHYREERERQNNTPRVAAL